MDGGEGNDLILAADATHTYTETFESGANGWTLEDLADGDIDLSAFYDDIWELQADYADDGVLTQSNNGQVIGSDTVDDSDNTSFAGGGIQFDGQTAIRSRRKTPMSSVLLQAR